ncbi:hypothetical protein K7432_012105 [Basidiobolus ranarum]|uniref:Uncharacterized protein n=1 Tax=Basidiobolus ranarum TaxID=34480 RepID=A0ABR2WLD6_9FUNG
MDPEARRAANLNVLQRLDRNITEILDSSSHVVVYKFDNDTQSWTKKGVEGTMFLFKREISPKYGFFVMNRLSIDNFIVYLNGNMDLQITTDFIIYRTGEEDIHGIWMYETRDRERVGHELVDYCERAKIEDAMPSITNSSVEPKHDILDMLQRAREKNPPTSERPNSHYQSPQDIPISVNPSSNQPDILGNLFRKANTAYQHTSAPQQAQPTPLPGGPITPGSSGGTAPDSNALLSLLQGGHTNPMAPSPSQLERPTMSHMQHNTISPHMPLHMPPILPPNVNRFSPHPPVLPHGMVPMPLLHPAQALDASISVIPPQHIGQNRPLSRAEYIGHYIHLLQNDPIFADLLYQRYLKQGSQEEVYRPNM